jgi:hypothetical protein
MAIFLEISETVVDAVETHPLGRISHVCVERLKSHPRIAHRNPTASVIRESTMHRISASLHHAFPCAVFFGTALSVCSSAYVVTPGMVYDGVSHDSSSKGLWLEPGSVLQARIGLAKFNAWNLQSKAKSLILRIAPLCMAAIVGCATVRVHHVAADKSVTDLYYNSLGKDVDLGAAKWNAAGVELQGAKGKVNETAGKFFDAAKAWAPK